MGRWVTCIEDPDKLNMTGLLYQAMRFNPRIQNLNKSDSNAVLSKVFKNINTGQRGVLSLQLLLDRFDTNAINLITKELAAKCYNSQEIDAIIRRLISIARQDLQRVYPIIGGISRKPNVNHSTLWYIMNQTAKTALKENVRWQDKLTNHNEIDQLIYDSNKDINEWLIHSGLGFDEKEYKAQVNRQKERDLQNALSRQMYKNITNAQNSKNSNVNNFNSRGNGQQKPKRRKGMSLNQAIREAEVFLHKYHPNTKWDMNFCVFFNIPSCDCKKEGSCKKDHKCPICQGAHPIHECPRKPIINQ